MYRFGSGNHCGQNGVRLWSRLVCLPKSSCDGFFWHSQLTLTIRLTQGSTEFSESKILPTTFRYWPRTSFWLESFVGKERRYHLDRLRTQLGLRSLWTIQDWAWISKQKWWSISCTFSANAFIEEGFRERPCAWPIESPGQCLTS